MRGKQGVRTGALWCPGFSPADAGKTQSYTRSARQRQDHPRGCGENYAPPAWVCLRSGSPPRMRGKQRIVVIHRTKSGITPADAGKTSVPALRYGQFADHPRGCGENVSFVEPPPAVNGSPPRMRGKQSAPHEQLRHIRITPADAGKTSTHVCGKKPLQDHPRGCGENASALTI